MPRLHSAHLEAAAGAGLTCSISVPGMATARFETIGDFMKYGVDVAIRCDNCRRRRTLTAEQLEAIFGLGTRVFAAQRRLRCSHCKGKGARLAPIPKLGG